MPCGKPGQEMSPPGEQHPESGEARKSAGQPESPECGADPLDWLVASSTNSLFLVAEISTDGGKGPFTGPFCRCGAACDTKWYRNAGFRGS